MSIQNEFIQIPLKISKKSYAKLEAIATIEDKSVDGIINRFINTNIGNDRKGCPYSHTPNKKTLKAIKEVEEGKDLVEIKDLDDFFKKLGI